MAIGRMKDFYDLWVLSNQFSFDGNTLVEALRATFERRSTALPDDTPAALTDDFANNSDKITQWTGFLARNKLQDTSTDLLEVVQQLRKFLLPPLSSAAKKETLNKSWAPGGPWSQNSWTKPKD
jgi:hypothetical protein